MALGPKEASSDELKALLQARLETVRKAYEEAVTASQQTRREGTFIILLARPQEVCTCSVNLLRAQLDLSAKKEDRIVALTSHLARITELEKRAKGLHEKGLIPSLEVRIVEFHRSEAAVWLAQK
jgi:predicted metal-dependent hydrolase